MSGDRRKKNQRPSQERRSDDRRLDPRMPVELWMRQESGDERVLRHAADLSPGGVRLDVGIPFPVGSQVTLQFRLPGDKRKITVTAEVVDSGWNEGRPRTNLRFLDLTADDHIRITRLIERHEG